MIGSLAGRVEHVGMDDLLLSVGGVGYRVFVLPTVLENTAEGHTLTVYTHLHVREDDLSLFGFLTMRELAFFHLLLQAPGVGPKTALGVMAVADVDVLIRAIAGGDVGLLTNVAGIGRKTAERIVVELKSRLEKEHPSLAERGTTAHADVVSALVGLGYSMAQARDAVRLLPPDIQNVEEGIRTALKALGSRVGR
jgi:Holliday junction DNA helicase RuvA